MTLTQKDLDEIENLIAEKLDEKLAILPTKEEFYKKMDEAMGELKAIREENAVNSHRLSKLEDIHPNYTHSSRNQ